MSLNWKRLRSWSPPGPHITTVDAHTGGEPLRVIVSGFPELEAATMLGRRKELEEHHDALRKILMWEPRGHADMYGCLITPPVSPKADFGVLFLHNEGYSTMCGHGIIAVAKVVLESGALPMRLPETRLQIDSPAGLVTVFAEIVDDHVDRISFLNVPSFADALEEKVAVPGLGEVTVDIGFGGAFYAYVQAAEVGLECTPAHLSELIRVGRDIKRAVADAIPVEHPDEADLGFLYGTIFVGPPEDSNNDSRHVCVFADGEVDRSPTGTGVSGWAALEYVHGAIGLHMPLTIESILGSTFTVTAVAQVEVDMADGIIPEVEGRAYITGTHSFSIDPKDPLGSGFLLR